MHILWEYNILGLLMHTQGICHQLIPFPTSCLFHYLALLVLVAVFYLVQFQVKYQPARSVKVY